jgi:hypothetical protein
VVVIRKVAAVALILGILVALAEHVFLPALIAAVILAVVVTVARWACVPRHHLPRNRVRDLRLRLHLRLHPGRGHATVAELFLRWGRLASYRESRRTRPDLSRWQRLTCPDAHSAFIGRAHYRHGIRVDVQTAGAVIGPPRSNKTALLSRIAQAAPGPLVVTSSKPDIFNLTSGVRLHRGHGVPWVFNPQGLGGIPSNVRWSPLAGADEPSVAIRRADAFSSAASTLGAEDAQFWAGKASDGLRGFFSAAALRNDDMRQVGAWVSASDLSDAISTLIAHHQDEFAANLAQLTGEAQKTAETVRMVMSRALGFLSDPALAAATLPGPGEQFDIDDFLLTGGTLYMLARSNGDDCTLGPLFAALAAEIHERALQLGSRMPGGRLQPPLQMILDEVTRIAPVPLPAWLADSGGQGVQVWSGFHGVSQLRSRWGQHGAQTVLDTSAVKVCTPGVTDPDMLEHLSRLCGKVSYRQHGQDESWQFTEVLSADMIRQLPPGFALVIRASNAVLIARLAKGWRYRPYRRLRRRGQHIAAVPAPADVSAAVPGTVTGRADLALPGTRKPADALPVASAGTSGNGHRGGEHPWSAR